MINYFFPPDTERGIEAVSSEVVTRSFVNTACFVEMFRGDEESRREPMEFVFRKNLLMMKERSSEYLHYHFSEDGSKLECFFMLVPNFASTFTIFEKVFKGGVLEFVLRYGLAPIRRLIQCSDWMDAYMAEVMKGRPRYYCLQRMIVNKDMQGKGVGSKYLGNALKKADEEQLPVFLSTHEQRNVVFYTRL